MEYVTTTNLGITDSIEISGLTSPVRIVSGDNEIPIAINFTDGVFMSMEKYTNDMKKARDAVLAEVSETLWETHLVYPRDEDDGE